MKALAHRGDNAFVIDSGGGIYALVDLDGEICLFAKKPEIFYKHGGFEEAEGITARKAKTVRRIIFETVQGLNEKNVYEVCIGNIGIPDVRKSFKID